MNDITKPSEYLGYWGEKYKNDLLTDILPFWLKYGIDKENGGYFTCLDRDGSLLDTNKSVWFQGRFAFYTRLCLQQPRKTGRMAGSLQKRDRLYREILFRYRWPSCFTK